MVSKVAFAQKVSQDQNAPIKWFGDLQEHIDVRINHVKPFSLNVSGPRKILSS